MSLITVAAVTLHTLPLDFEANRDAILEGIREARRQGATVIATPELCIPGYGALDHHLEADTFVHSWEMLSQIIVDEACKDVLVDVGLGVRHRNVRYNSRVLFTYKHIYLIRPKQCLANDGLYREARHFSPWQKPRVVETYYLEDIVADITGQRTVPIGDAIISTRDTSVYMETCEELFVPANPSIGAGLNGAEIILNSSASHAELQKLRTRLDLIANSTRKLGGIYVYSNAVGVDGEARQMFDGSSMIVVNGDVLSQDDQFTLSTTSVITATIDLEQVRSYRSCISRNIQAGSQSEFPRVEAALRLSRPTEETFLSGAPKISRPIDIRVLDPMEEIHKSTAVWLWQYLVTTRSPGFLLPLSGGADSCTTALMVYGMARLVLRFINDHNAQVLAELRQITGEKDFLPQTPQEIVNKLFHTIYLGTVNSGPDTRRRALNLARELGAYHSDTNIDSQINGCQEFISQTLGFQPRFGIHGGTNSENLALQNIQARSRMLSAYFVAQLSTTARKTPRAGASLLVLGSANVDEILRGYLTKYDASSADINPLGSISKTDIFRFMRWAMVTWNLPSLDGFLNAVPSAELIPLQEGRVQTDEEEMGLTYEQLSKFGKLRKIDKLGPWSTYLRLLSDWGDTKTPSEIADLTKVFYRFYALNRHKSTVLTPSIHLSAYSPDDNRFDLRPFLYKVTWPLQFRKISNHADALEAKLGKKTIKAD